MHKTHSQNYLGLLLMLGFLFNSATASQKDYPQLHENKALSDNYEIVKLIDGPIDSLYRINSTGEFIAQSDSKLWKINAQGEVIDFLRPDNFYASGLILEKEGFIDWVFTGDKQLKPYGKTVDANAYTEKELFSTFDQADATEFVEEDETTGLVYLYKQGQMSILDISTQAEKIDDFYFTQSTRKDHNLRREETDIKASRFENYHQKNPPFEFLSSVDESSTANIKISEFKKVANHRDHSITETFFENTLGVMLFGGSRRDYSFPVGYLKYELTHKNETLKFSVFGDKEYDEENAWNFSVLEPQQTNTSDLTFLTTNYRRHYLAELNEMSLLPYYEKDVGLYVVRKKTPHNQVAASAWQVSYSGLHSYDAIWGHINFDNPSLNSVYYWFWQSRPIPAQARADIDSFGRRAEIASPVLKTLPTSLDFHWLDFKRDRNFRLVINSQDAEFYKPDDTRIAIKLYFDTNEFKQAFTQFAGATHTIELNLDLQERKYGGELVVSLKNQNKTIVLKNTSFDYQEIPYAPKSPRAIPGKMQTDLFMAYQNSLLTQDPNGFLDKMDQLKKLNAIADCASSISFYFAQLSLNLNSHGKFTESTKLFDRYFTFHQDITRNPIDELQRKNQVVLASQGIYLGSNTQNKDLNKKIVQLFVEQNFDLARETNRVFLFNIACYYAINHNKPQMLKIINRAIELGKNPEDFLKDTDFTNYWQDPDFLSAIGK